MYILQCDTLDGNVPRHSVKRLPARSFLVDLLEAPTIAAAATAATTAITLSKSLEGETGKQAEAVVVTRANGVRGYIITPPLLPMVGGWGGGVVREGD